MNSLPSQASPKQERELPNSSEQDLATMVAAILSNFWTDQDPKVHATNIASWCRTLSGMTAQEVNRAWGEYQKQGPRDQAGRLARPVAEDLRKLVDRERAWRHRIHREALPPPPEPARDPVGKEAASQIMERAGFTPKRLRDLQRAPMAATFDEAEAVASRPVVTHWSEKADPRGPEMIALCQSRAKTIPGYVLPEWAK